MRVPAWRSLVAAAALVAGQSLAAAPPAAADTGPIVISADMPAAVPAGKMWSFNDFFPRTLTVTQGETIGFAIQGFHTATLLPAGVSAVTDQAQSGIATADDDVTPNPNGTSHVAINIPAVMPTSFTCGDAANPCAFDGSSVVSSGAPLAGPPAGPFMVTVTAKPGTYQFLCRIHPGMRGQITVVDSKAEATTAGQVARTVERQVQQDVKAGYAAEKRATDGSSMKNADGTTTWFVTPGASSPDRHVAVLEFLPQNIDIKAGDKVVWRMQESNEPHTVTFPTDLGTDQVPVCETSGGGADGPFGPPTFSCPGGAPPEIEFGGGNGVSTVSSPATVSDSGLLGTKRLAHAFGLPSTALLGSWTVSFTGATPGTYTYVCQIHEGMEATITVH